jgi:hypothetical protein
MSDVPDEHLELQLHTHISMPINADGDGPEMDPDKVVDVICWSCLETWPCAAYASGHPAGE